MTNEQREAIETMQHWIEYEKKHKDEINKADELIHIQDTVLSLIKEQEEEIAKYEKIYKEYDCYRWVKELNKKDKQIDLMAEMIDELSEYYTRYHGKNNEFCKEICIEKDIDCKDCIKQYFAGLVEKE